MATAPGLLFGFLLAGLIHVLLPTGAIAKHLREPGFKSIVKASAIGVPLPLCSCSVIPVGVTLRRQGASKGATLSFMVSTPEIGADSLVLSWFVLGPLLAVVRALAAFFSALFVGLAADYLDHESAQSSKIEEPQVADVKTERARSGNAIREALTYSFRELFDDLAVMLILGIFLAALLDTFIPSDFIGKLNISVAAQMLLMLLISFPSYVCATSSTPLAAVLLSKGVPVGAVLVFLLAGPASNVATVLAVKRELGIRCLVIYIVGVSVVAVLCGALLQSFSGSLSGISAYATAEMHSEGVSLFSIICAVIFGALLFRSVAMKFYKRQKKNGTEDCCCCS